MTFITIHDVCVSKDGHIFRFTCQTARRRHASSPGANWVPGHPSVQRHFTSNHDSPDGSSAPRDRLLLAMSALSRRGPASRLEPGRGPPLGALCRDDSTKLFGDSHRARPPGLADATCSVVCATKLARWGSSGATPAFRLSPALAGLRLLLRLYLIGRRQVTDFLRPRFPTLLQACHQEALPVRTAQ